MVSNLANMVDGCVREAAKEIENINSPGTGRLID